MTLQPGSRPVPNYPDYELIRKLGAGAFGEVWHANGPGGFEVALKFIRLGQQGLALELRSLEAVKSIRHPNLVSLFGAWLSDSWLILSMELCDCSLQEVLAVALDRGLPGVPLSSLLKWVTDAANGLDTLNAKQVQHRDVKPGNLLLLNSGLKVADFGVAKVLEQTVASNTGGGTIAYMAPECFKGKLAQQSDQYSLAVTYYHVRTGRPLFQGDQAQVMYGHLELEPDLSALPPEERVVLARALAKEPSKRWPSCTAFAQELKKFQWEKGGLSRANDAIPAGQSGGRPLARPQGGASRLGGRSPSDKGVFAPVSVVRASPGNTLPVPAKKNRATVWPPRLTYAFMAGFYSMMLSFFPMSYFEVRHPVGLALLCFGGPAIATVYVVASIVLLRRRGVERVADKQGTPPTLMS